MRLPLFTALAGAIADGWGARVGALGGIKSDGENKRNGEAQSESAGALQAEHGADELRCHSRGEARACREAIHH